MVLFKHSYKDLTNYDIIEYTDKYSPRVVSPEYFVYVDWIADGNIPEKISGNEFITIVDGEPVIDPNKDNILLSRQWSMIRSHRDSLLLQCDWTQIPDSPKYQNQDWLTYRQALRDITEQEDPYNIVLPEEPTEVE